MITAKTELGRGMQRIRWIARLDAAEKFLRDNNRHSEADAVYATRALVAELEFSTAIDPVTVGG